MKDRKLNFARWNLICCAEQYIVQKLDEIRLERGHFEVCGRGILVNTRGMCTA
jgi:hypothetical protein